MFDQKIEKARNQQRRHWQLALGFLATALAGGLLAAVFLAGDRLGPSPDPAARQATSGGGAGSAPGVAAEASAPDTVSETNPEADRERFKELLAAFERQRQPRLVSDAFGRWRPGLADTLIAQKEAAVEAFAQGRYDQALAGISSLIERADDLLGKRDDRIDRLRSEAEVALATDDLDRAEIAIEEGLMLAPDDIAFQEFRQALDARPALLEALKQAEVARAENRPGRELTHVRNALQIAPDRPGLAEREKRLAARVAEFAYGEAVSRSDRALQAGDPVGARQALTSARAEKPNGDDLARLEREIKALERRLAFRGLIDKAEGAAERDDWPAAEDAFAAAVAMEPSDSLALRGLELARRMVAETGRLRSVLARPERLSSQQVRDDTQSALDQSGPLAAISPSLAAKHAEASALVEAYAKPVDVTVISDGETFVFVRTLGKIGHVAQKTIQLTPGSYVFEGRRNGYRSKAVRLELAPGTNDATIEVICDEPV